MLFTPHKIFEVSLMSLPRQSGSPSQSVYRPAHFCTVWVSLRQTHTHVLWSKACVWRSSLLLLFLCLTAVSTTSVSWNHLYLMVMEINKTRRTQWTNYIYIDLILLSTYIYLYCPCLMSSMWPYLHLNLIVCAAIWFTWTPCKLCSLK